MTEPQLFQIRQAAQSPVLGAMIPVTVELRLSFEPWLLAAVAEQSRREGCRLEDVIIEVLWEKFSE